MEGKVRNYQTKFKSVNQENEALRDTMVQSQSKMVEMEKELKKQKSQIRCKNLFIFKILSKLSILLLSHCSFTNLSFYFLWFLSEYEEELQALSGVREELEKVSSDKSTLQKELSDLEGKYKVMETLRDSQETELQTLKV